MGFDLGGFTGAGYDKGRPVVVQAAWVAVQNGIFKRTWLPARLRVSILRAFGAQIGSGVLIRHGVRVHWPWKLSVGDNSWIGEGAWILNLEPVSIGSNVCISQEALLCTGSHSRRSPTFEFDNGPIEIKDGAWLAVRSVVLRGVTVGCNATVGAAGVAHQDVPDDGAVLAAMRTEAL